MRFKQIVHGTLVHVHRINDKQPSGQKSTCLLQQYISKHLKKAVSQTRRPKKAVFLLVLRSYISGFGEAPFSLVNSD